MTGREATEIPMVASRDNRLVLSRMSPVSLEKAGGTGSRRLRSSRALDEKYPMLLVFRPRSSSRVTLQHTDRPDQLTDASFEENQPPLLVPERQLLVRGRDSF
ncbi:hypothetical protein FOQG_04202 [Fusarium oxysporum f. sp. raphani 54005]|uniref:Uncharacterized protein n=1 Tax=Fusarium oxysporum f. sp. raphani 54005 TaxID=1089458 RepID=X0DMS7_FUSOX|nr:hypothetical protein FOQG_04202 [Fusarium oxysporum f. sp. raphani 54005]